MIKRWLAIIMVNTKAHKLLVGSPLFSIQRSYVQRIFNKVRLLRGSMAGAFPPALTSLNEQALSWDYSLVGPLHPGYC